MKGGGKRHVSKKGGELCKGKGFSQCESTRWRTKKKIASAERRNEKGEERLAQFSQERGHLATLRKKKGLIGKSRGVRRCKRRRNAQEKVYLKKGRESFS